MPERSSLKQRSSIETDAYLVIRLWLNAGMLVLSLAVGGIDCAMMIIKALKFCAD